MKWCLLMVGLAVAVLPGAPGQEVEPPLDEPQDKPPGWLRLLAVGDKPPFRQAIIEGVRVELPPPPGSLPPRQVLVPGLGEEEARQRLQLGVVTSPVASVPGVKPLRGVTENGTVQAWMRVRMPEHPAVLAILFRDPRAKSWDEARSLVLRDDLATHPEGAVRVVNASTFLTRVKLGEKTTELEPGESVVRKRAEVGELRNIPVQVEIRSANGWQKIYDSGLSQARGERTNVVVYRSDGERPRRPAKALVLKERAFLPKLPKRAGAAD